MNYYLAIDIGASSGRHILGSVENDTFIMEEVHRFENKIIKKDGQLCWDLTLLFEEILEGMKKCKTLGKVPMSVGIDTWGVDYVLMGNQDNVVGNFVSYRDERTHGMDVAVEAKMPMSELYQRTGIPKYMYNTIYQLMAEKNTSALKGVKTLLMVPDYLHYRLTGVKKTEYSIASTTGLLNANTRNWDDEIMTACGFPRDIFQDIIMPGSYLGDLSSDIEAYVGYQTKVVVPPTHDTQSAAVANPADTDDALFISSGTWSLMGFERSTPDCSPDALALGFTNEGGYDGIITFVKNIMGLWMVQCIKRELGDQYSFAELCGLAQQSGIQSIINCDDERFFAPENMIEQIKQACVETGQQVPVTPGEVAAVAYHSLARLYQQAADNLETLTGKQFSSINIIGGGSNASYLNDLTEHYTGKKVFSGPAEATAMGNLLTQMMHDHTVSDIKHAKRLVKQSLLNH